MKSGLKKVPIHLTSAQNRLIIKNGTVVNCDGEQQVDVYMEVRLGEDYKNLTYCEDITLHTCSPYSYSLFSWRGELRGEKFPR